MTYLPALYAFAAGLTVAGIAATLLQIMSGRTVVFAGPFITPERPALSLLVAAFAGPYMVLNEALCAYRAGTVVLNVVALAMVAAGWALALGVLSISLAVALAVLLR